MWLFKKKEKISDEQLAAEYFVTGDKALIGILFENHVKTVYGVCLFYFRDRDKAQDEVMQIFEKLIVELQKNEVRNFKAWLSFVVRNHCLNELRKSKGKYFVDEKYLDYEINDADLKEEEKINSVKEDQMLQYMTEVLPTLKPTVSSC